jgi:hypothetical protein
LYPIFQAKTIADRIITTKGIATPIPTLASVERLEPEAGPGFDVEELVAAVLLLVGALLVGAPLVAELVLVGELAVTVLL